jgi:hypothetical protein
MPHRDIFSWRPRQLAPVIAALLYRIAEHGGNIHIVSEGTSPYETEGRKYGNFVALQANLPNNFHPPTLLYGSFQKGPR